MRTRSGALAMVLLGLGVLLLGGAPACVTEEDPAARSGPRPDGAHGGKVPHADHRPYHGGQVGMSGDIHLEVAASPSGLHRVYLSDAVRSPISAAGQGGRYIVTRPDGSSEALELRPHASGDYLEAFGRPLGPGQVLGRVQMDVRTGKAAQPVIMDFLVAGPGIVAPGADAGTAQTAPVERRRFLIPPGQRGGKMTPTRIFP